MRLSWLALAVFAFLVSSPAWATPSSCQDQNKNSSDGCTIVNSQFSNVLIPTNLIFENTNVFAYQQTANSPCIYDNSSCNNGGFPTVLLNGDTNKDNVVSQQYTVAQLLAVLTVPQFFVGIDVNTTGGHGTETLEKFDMLVNGSVTYPLGGSNDLGLALLVGNNPGNGYSDDLIRGFNLAGLNSTDIVTFIMSEHGDVGGREQFFLIANVPEPGTLGLMGGALAMLGFFAWRRKSSAAA